VRESEAARRISQRRLDDRVLVRVPTGDTVLPGRTRGRGRSLIRSSLTTAK
jgi:hypothetical protein